MESCDASGRIDTKEIGKKIFFNDLKIIIKIDKNKSKEKKSIWQ